MTLLSFDGKNLKSIDRGFADVFYPSSRNSTRNATVVGGLTTNQVYAMVAQAFRCVTMRANEVSRVPRALLDESGKDVTEQFKDLMLPDDFIYSWEASECLSGRAYAILDVNPSGYNAKPRWVISGSVTAVYSGHPRRLQYFQRSEEINPRIDPSRMLYWWAKNFEREDEPGPGETEVALGPASSLYAINGMLAGYFNGGAVKVTVFPVPSGTPDKDREEFQNWLNKRLSGVRNAFKNIVMRTKDGELKPVVIGSDVKDTQASEISQDLRNDIATAHGIPPNIVSGEYKYATADSEYLGWIVGEIIPRTDRMFEVLTRQYYSRYGLRLVTQPKKMEVLQTAQLAQITAVQAAVGRPIMLMREGRAIGDLDSVEKLTVSEMAELGLPLPEPVLPPKPVRVLPPASAAVIDNPAAPALNSGKPVKVESGETAKRYLTEDEIRSYGKPTRVTKAAIADVTVEALKAWRKKAMDNIAQDLPAHYGCPVVDDDSILDKSLFKRVWEEIENSKSTKAVRAVFERAIAEVKATQEPESVSDMRYLADALLVAAKAVEVSG